MGNNSGNSIPPVQALAGKKIPTINTRPAVHGPTLDLPPAFSFLHFDSSPECASSWPGEAIKNLFARFKHVNSMTWEQVFKTGGKAGDKTGVGYTLINPKTCARKLPQYLSEDIELSEMRINRKSRILGVRHEATYFVIWLDRNHEATK